MDNDTPPDWALIRVYDFVHPSEAQFAPEKSKIMSVTVKGTVGRAFARYIAQHETPPVDPDLVEAREMAAKWEESNGRHGWAKLTRDGKCDDCPEVQFHFAALKRGRELEREGGK